MALHIVFEKIKAFVDDGEPLSTFLIEVEP